MEVTSTEVSQSTLAAPSIAYGKAHSRPFSSRLVASKVLAEKAAWKFLVDNPEVTWGIATVNPP